MMCIAVLVCSVSSLPASIRDRPEASAIKMISWSWAYSSTAAPVSSALTSCPAAQRPSAAGVGSSREARAEPPSRQPVEVVAVRLVRRRRKSR